MRFAVVGVGYWGRNYLRLLAQRPDVDAAVLADASGAALEDAAPQAPGARLTCDPFEAITAPDVEAVVIATPATTHYELASTALRAGKAVLCEKPLATTVAHCEELAHLAADAGHVLFVGHTFIYNPAVQTAKRLFRAHELGDTVHAHAAWTAPGPIRHDVNALWDLAPHPLSIITYLLERQPTTVSATGQAVLGEEREDVVFLHLRFDDYATADVHLSWLAPRKVRMLTLTGDRRLVVFDDMSPVEKLHVYDTSVVKNEGARTRLRFLPERPVIVPDIPKAEPLAEQLDHFLECCRLDALPQSGGLDGTNVVRLLEAAQQSLAAGGRPVAPEDLPVVA